MFYKDYLKTLDTCPFCELTKNRIIKKDALSFLTYSIAPYHKHHLMVIPYRHIESFKELNEEETKSIEKLLHEGVNLLTTLGYEDYTILLRNGKKDGKSIQHLHYHIVPIVIIGDVDHNSDERKIMSDEDMSQLMNELKEIKYNV